MTLWMTPFLLIAQAGNNQAALDEDVDKPNEDDQFESVFVQADRVVTSTNAMDEDVLIEDIFVQSDHAQQIMVTVDGDLVKDDSETDNVHDDEHMENDHFKNHVAHADEKKETPVIVDEKKLSTFTMDGDVCQM
ncbi:hypothetical protein ACJX0J_022816, partial [Zea mays]